MSNTTLPTIDSSLLTSVAGGVTARWLGNHPFAAQAFLEHHPVRAAQFTANHPFMADRIKRVAGAY